MFISATIITSLRREPSLVFTSKITIFRHSFYRADGVFLCSECAQKNRGCCARCGKTADGDIYEALGARWHVQCFTCTQCGKQLTDEYADCDGKVLFLNTIFSFGHFKSFLPFTPFSRFARPSALLNIVDVFARRATSLALARS